MLDRIKEHAKIIKELELIVRKVHDKIEHMKISRMNPYYEIQDNGLHTPSGYFNLHTDSVVFGVESPYPYENIVYYLRLPIEFITDTEKALENLPKMVEEEEAKLREKERISMEKESERRERYAKKREQEKREKRLVLLKTLKKEFEE